MSVKNRIREALPRLSKILRSRYQKDMIGRHKAMVTELSIQRELAKLYKKRVGAELDLLNPITYTEKAQWSKLYDRNCMKSVLSDKVAVREWVGNRIGYEYLIPLIGTWDSVDEIDFEKLPESFVLKTNNASATNIIVPDKSMVSFEKLKRTLQDWLKIEFGWYLFEFQYLYIPPKIIAEKYMKDSDHFELQDYKFLCFDGSPRFVWVDSDRYSSHKRATFDLDWNLQDWSFGSYPRPVELPEKPVCFDEIVELVRRLAEGFSHVRVDMYVISGRPYFGEMTFTSGGGFEPVFPSEMDAKLGALWKIDASKQNPWPELNR